MTTLTVTLSVTMPDAAPPLALGAGERLALRVAEGLQARVHRRAAARTARIAADLAREGLIAESRRAGDRAAAVNGVGALRW
ncbi:hypothetical protein [Microbacterium sp. JZ37]|uniref:hypothetical protein n=1 Tax=Microbacterium sp. JZ37 TaxID=2654193 RepID=UPI002B46D48E|nr:hypothetical protein [Microbacterium sp. JZ37]WRH17316.1 hypothetical protein GC092_07195 [Microbacterium sp. JZ37]